MYAMLLASAFGQSHSAVAILRAADGCIVDVNPVFERSFGVRCADLRMSQGVALASWLAPATSAEILAQLRNNNCIAATPLQVGLADGRVWRGLLTCEKVVADEETFLLAIAQEYPKNAEVSILDGDRARYLALFPTAIEGLPVDIGDRPTAEALIKQSEALYRTLVDNSSEGVFLIQHGKVLFLNQMLADMLGYEVTELIGIEYLDIVAPESREEQQRRRSSREGGSRDLQNYEIVLCRKDGALRLFSVRAGAVDFQGAPASTGTMRDITEERQQQRQLEQAERKYRELFMNSVTGMFQTSLDGRILEANAAAARMLGYESLDDFRSRVSYMHEVYSRQEDRQKLLEALTTQGSIHDHEYQATRGDGHLMWVAANVRVVRKEDGSVSHFEGSLQDVTARHDAEQALLASEARYRTLVEHAQVGVYLMAGERYTYVNHAFAEIMGYSEAELIGSSFRTLLAPESLAEEEDRYRRRERRERTPDRDYESVVLRKDGSRATVVISAGRLEGFDEVVHCGTARDVTAQRRFEKDLERNATHDMLTGLPNRLLFERSLANRLGDVEQTENGYAVLFLDLDSFEIVNDSLGHAAGDQLLVSITQRLQNAFAGEALVARYGGDEFTLLPHGPCPDYRAQALAKRVLDLFVEPFEIQGHKIYSGASLGIVLGHTQYHSPDQVLRDADTAMYRAKAAGKSAYVIFDQAMHMAARARLTLQTELRSALERGEFRIHYQPIMDLISGQVSACEALVRWQHPTRGLLGPPQFLAAAEEIGLIVPLDWWVLEQACRQLTAWKRKYPGSQQMRINVNMDEYQFAHPGLIASLKSVLQRTGIDPSCLALEVTETVFRRGRAAAEETFYALKDLGVLLAVDDFGTGYSSLESFASSPIDAVKIDRSFIMDMETNPRHRAIVRTIIGLAAELGLMVTGEGVETPGQAQLLLSLGCSSAQGFLYARPQPAEAIDQLLAAAHAHARRA